MDCRAAEVWGGCGNRNSGLGFAKHPSFFLREGGAGQDRALPREVFVLDADPRGWSGGYPASSTGELDVVAFIAKAVAELERKGQSFCPPEEVGSREGLCLGVKIVTGTRSPLGPSGLSCSSGLGAVFLGAL